MTDDQEDRVAWLAAEVQKRIKASLNAGDQPINVASAQLAMERALATSADTGSIEHVRVETTVDPDDRTMLRIRLTALTPSGKEMIERIERLAAESPYLPPDQSADP